MSATASTSSGFVSTPEWLCIKSGYRSRQSPDYFYDGQNQVVSYQPDVYPFAGYLAERFGCRYIIDVGCGTADKLVALYPRFEVIGIDFESNIDRCRQAYSFGQWLEVDLERPAQPSIAESVLAQAVIVCADVLEHLVDPTHVLALLRRWLDIAPIALLSTPERDLVRGPDHIGPPPNPSHVREWNLAEAERLLVSAAVNVEFIGLTASNDIGFEKKTILAVITGQRNEQRARGALSNLRTRAFLVTYNDEDIVTAALRRLLATGVEVHVLDGGSHDGTCELARQFQGRGVIAVDRHRRWRDSGSLVWQRIQRASANEDADWLLCLFADEELMTPWTGSLETAMKSVHDSGFDAVDATTVNLYSTPLESDRQSDLLRDLTRFDFDRTAQPRVVAWRRSKASRVVSHDHAPSVNGNGLYPYRFVVKRHVRCNPTQLVRRVLNAGGVNVKESDAALLCERLRLGTDVTQFDQLEDFVEDEFRKTFLVERLSGIGVQRHRPTNPWQTAILNRTRALLRASEKTLDSLRSAVEKDGGT